MQTRQMLTISGTVCVALCLAGVSFGQAGAASSVQTFDSAQDAAAALIHAAEANDTAALDAIFGPAGKRVLSSGDAQRDQQERTQFAKLAAGKHALQPDPMNHDRMILAVGSEDWPFPVPIVRKDGKWSFDATQGATEMRARRIGGNELDTVEICAGFVEAQQEYALADHGKKGTQHYAERILSSPGQQDGLYWEGSGAKPLVPKRFAEAAMESGNKATPYHGYYFRILKAQGSNAPGGAHSFVAKDVMMGGFALIAWPAEYGVTGVHTFIVNQSGQIYEKKLGKSTSTIVRGITKFDPDPSWTLVQ